MEKITANFWKAKSAASFRLPLLIFCFQILFWNLIIETVFAEPGCKHKSLLKPLLWCSCLRNHRAFDVRWRRGKLVCFKKRNPMCEGKGAHLHVVWGPKAAPLHHPGPGLGFSPQGELGMSPQPCSVNPSWCSCDGAIVWFTEVQVSVYSCSLGSVKTLKPMLT